MPEAKRKKRTIGRELLLEGNSGGRGKKRYGQAGCSGGAQTG